MDWFERLTGFRETNYLGTRAKFRVEGQHLISLVNGERYDGARDLKHLLNALTPQSA